MKLHTQASVVERCGVQAESSFTIKTNALSFSILSSGLYTDPEMAIVRELSCNAYDAHVAAGNERSPFEIHLPNDLEPFLSIKDWGTGLPDEDIQGAQVPVLVENDNGEFVEATNDSGEQIYKRTGGLYTTYFDSTKTDSNDYIGALGLGSKSPFSYTNAFEVISRHKGKKRTYAIFLNEEGIPTVARLGEIDTDEQSGLEVKIAIEPKHFYKFKEKTAAALKFFPVKPKVIGALGFEFNKLPEHRIQTENWMLSSVGSYMSSSIVAVQGNVPYRVSLEQIKPHLLSEAITFAERSHIIMFFDIGKLEVSANREEIRYDEKSVEAIANQLREVYKEFTYEVEKKIGQVNDKYWFACMELNKLSKSLFGREDSIRTFVNPDVVKDKNLKRYISEYGKISTSNLLGYDFKSYRHANAKILRGNVPNVIVPEYDILIVLNDVKTGCIKRISNYLKKSNRYSRVLVLNKLSTPIVEFDVDNEPMEYCGYNVEFERLVEQLGNPDVHLVSEITDELEKKVTSRDLTFYIYGGTYNTRNYYTDDKIRWEQTTCDLKDGGLYFPLKYRSTPCFVDKHGKLQSLGFDDCFFTLDTMTFLIDAFNAEHGTKHTTDSIIGMPSAAFNKAKKLSNWVNLFEYAKTVLPDLVDEISYHKRLKATACVLDTKSAVGFSEFVSQVKNLDDDSEFKKTLMPLIVGKEKSRDHVMQFASNIEYLYHIFFPKEEIVSTQFYGSDAFDTYPMLTMIDTVNDHTKWPLLFEYIQMIDRSKK